MKIIFAFAALAATLGAIQAGAQSTVDGSPLTNLTRPQALERADRLFDQFDVNHDGVVTRQEAQQVGARLEKARMLTGRDVAPGLGGHTLRFLRRRFAGMESVARNQFEAAMLAHFDEMDTDHDGILTPAERKAVPDRPDGIAQNPTGSSGA